MEVKRVSWELEPRFITSCSATKTKAKENFFQYFQKKSDSLFFATKTKAKKNVFNVCKYPQGLLLHKKKEKLLFFLSIFANVLKFSRSSRKLKKILYYLQISSKYIFSTLKCYNLPTFSGLMKLFCLL